MTKKFVSKSIAFLASICLVLVGSTAAEGATTATSSQKVNYYISGDCLDYYDEYGEYAMLEEYEDWNCLITVRIKPVKPARTVKLQWWDDNEGTWVTEYTGKTNSKGVATLEFDPYCEDSDTGDEYYCDGTWDYRVSVIKTGNYKATNSVTWSMNFYPYDSSY